MSDLSRTGLSARSIAAIRAIFARFPEIESAVLYGSRAKGTHKPGSDLDITLFGDRLSEHILLRVAGAFDDSSLPYTADLSRFASLKNEELREHIARVGLEIYRREPSAQSPE